MTVQFHGSMIESDKTHKKYGYTELWDDKAEIIVTDRKNRIWNHER